MPEKGCMGRFYPLLCPRDALREWHRARIPHGDAMGRLTGPLFPGPLDEVINVASVPQRSPFRYPGGKTWLIPHLRRWLCAQRARPRRFVEPFAGGAIAGLTVAFENLADSVTLVELDEDVAAVWETILNGHAASLAERVLSFNLSPGRVRILFSRPPRTREGRAFATLVRNRVQHGGILAPGASFMKEGENGKGIHSRWYAATLAKRIRAIESVSDRIHFEHGDGFAVIERYRLSPNTVFFVDPPYTVAGKRLYRHSDVGHERLFSLLGEVAGDFLMTYDCTDEVKRWARRHGFETATVAMQNRQNARKSELLIGRNLRWARV